MKLIEFNKEHNVHINTSNKTRFDNRKQAGRIYSLEIGITIVFKYLHC